MSDKYLDKLNKVLLRKSQPTQPQEAQMNIEKTLQERNATHGDFRDGAKISQRLKKVVSAYETNLTPVQKESLDMIMHKVARLLNGDPTHTDTWHDIIGYATLAIEDIEASKLDDLAQDHAI